MEPGKTAGEETIDRKRKIRKLADFIEGPSNILYSSIEGMKDDVFSRIVAGV